jgi:hypothetical protein
MRIKHVHVIMGGFAVGGARVLFLPLDEEVLNVEQAAKSKKCVLSQTPILAAQVTTRIDQFE